MYRGRITNILLGGRYLYLPWAYAVGVQWSYQDEIRNGVQHNDTLPASVALSDLTLYPAPGEELHINITAVDDMLGVQTASLMVKV